MIRHSKPAFRKNDLSEVSGILTSGDHAAKRAVKKFEERLSAYIGAKGALATSSGTAALHLALLSLGIKEEDEVIVPSFICTAVLNAVNYVGARPVLADVSEDDLNISRSSVVSKLTKRTKAIVLAHMFGLPVDVRPFLNLGPYIIEDCVQSLGAETDGRKTGSMGHVSIFSFYATKLISTGHGGMLASGSKAILRRAADLLDFDNRKHYKVRYNYNMSDIQAAIGVAQLSRLDEFLKIRASIAAYYDRQLAGMPVKLPIKKENIYYRYIVRVERGAQGLIASLNRQGVEAKRPIFKPLHQYLGLEGRDFPNAEKAFRESISLPIYPDLRAAERAKVVRALISALEGGRCW